MLTPRSAQENFYSALKKLVKSALDTATLNSKYVLKLEHFALKF